MAIAERARRNHEALFPGHVSALGVSEPELVEPFDTWGPRRGAGGRRARGSLAGGPALV